MKTERSYRQVGLGLLVTLALAAVGCGLVTRVSADAKADTKQDGSVGNDTPVDTAEDVTEDAAADTVADVAAEQAADRPPEAKPDVAADLAGDMSVDRPPDMSVDRPPEAPTEARPDGPCTCPAIYMPVCGVDGRTYGNSCQAACVGVAIAHTGACTDAGIDPVCLTPASCTFYPTLGPGCCGACRAKGQPAPPQINCLIACRDPHTGCVCVNGNCTPTGGGGGGTTSF